MTRRAAFVSLIALLVLPSTAHAARINHYFVSPLGSDSDLGDQAHPLRTIGAAVEHAEAGDTVIATAGVYREAVMLTGAGSPQAPIVVRGLPGAVLVSPDADANLSAFDIKSGAAHLTIEGFDIGGGYGEAVFVRSGAHDIVLSGLYVHDNRTGIWIGGAERVVVRDSRIERHYRNGIRLFAGAHAIEIRDTLVAGSDDGQGCDGDADGIAADETTSDIALDGVESSRNAEDGFDLQGSGTSLMRSTARDNGCTGVKLNGGGFVENLLVERSRVGLSAGGDAVLQSCTLVDNALGLRLLTSGTTVTIRNSIVTGPAKALSYAADVTVIEDHNVFHRPNLKDRLIVRTELDGAETLFSGADLNAGLWPHGEGTMAADPELELDGCAPSAASQVVDRGACRRSLLPMPQLTLRRVAMKANPDGIGRLRLSAAMDIAAGLAFDPLVDSTTVAVRGAGGEAMHLEVTPASWKRVRSGRETTLRATFSDTRMGRVRLTLRVGAARIRLSLDVAAAALWSLDDGALTLSVDSGALHASVERAA